MKKGYFHYPGPASWAIVQNDAAWCVLVVFWFGLALGSYPALALVDHAQPFNASMSVLTSAVLVSLFCAPRQSLLTMSTLPAVGLVSAGLGFVIGLTCFDTDVSVRLTDFLWLLLGVYVIELYRSKMTDVESNSDHASDLGYAKRHYLSVDGLVFLVFLSILVAFLLLSLSFMAAAS